jgi:hypothetical protein
MLDEMMAACETVGLRPVGTTLREVVDQVLAQPPVQEPFVCEGAIFDLTASRAEIGIPA